MKKLLIILIFFFLVFSGIAQASSILVQESDSGITIQSDDAPLGEVLGAIESQTGINFSVSEEVWGDPVTVNLKVPDWKTGVDAVLQSFNQMAIWNQHLDKTKIRVLSRSEEVVYEPVVSQPQVVTPTHIPNEAEAGSSGSGETGSGPQMVASIPSKPLPKLDKSRLPKSLGLDRKKLRRISRGNLKSPISPVFLSDPEMAVFLAQFGIRTAEDAKDTTKAMKARVHARRMAK